MCGTVCSASDIIAPNLVELEILCEHAVNNVEEAVLAARELIAQGPQIVLVKHRRELATAVTVFEMLLVTADEASAYQPSAGGFWYAPAVR